MTEAYNEARQELAESGEDEETIEERAREQAEQDLTYTESGYIPSWEWSCDCSMTRAAILETLNRPKEYRDRGVDKLARRYPGQFAAQYRARKVEPKASASAAAAVVKAARDFLSGYDA